MAPGTAQRLSKKNKTVKDLVQASALFRMLDNAAPTIDDAKTIMRRQNITALERMLNLSPQDD